MIAAPQIELATLADLDALAQMRVEMGWHRSEALLRAVLGWEQGRVFVVRAGALAAAAEGGDPQTLAATTSAIAAGPVGVIGNVAVRAQFQRRGLGEIIMRHALAWQRAQGVQDVWLDATPEGRPLYRKLGFQPVTPSWFAYAPLDALDLKRLGDMAKDVVVSRRHSADLAHLAVKDRISMMDQLAFGGDRLGLLSALLRQEGVTFFIAHRRGPKSFPLGYAFSRRLEPPPAGVRIGPLVARNDQAAAALTLAVVAAAQRIAADTGEQPTPSLFASGASDLPRARAFFTAIGMPPEDDDLVMRLNLATPTIPPDAADTTGRPSVYSWVSPMTF